MSMARDSCAAHSRASSVRRLSGPVKARISTCSWPVGAQGSDPLSGLIPARPVDLSRSGVKPRRRFEYNRHTPVGIVEAAWAANRRGDGLCLCEFAGFDQSRFGVLTDDFEESEPRRCPAAVGYDKRLVDQTAQHRDSLTEAAYLARCVQVETSGEHGQPAQRLSLSGGEQLEAPIQRRSQRLLAVDNSFSLVGFASASPSRSRIWAADRWASRAAANSSARGMPSSCRHIAATFGPVVSSRTKDGSTAWARLRNSSTDSTPASSVTTRTPSSGGRLRDGVRHTISPVSASGSRLVARTTRSGQRANSSPTRQANMGRRSHNCRGRVADVGRPVVDQDARRTALPR